MRYTNYKPPTEDAEEESPSQDKTDRCGTDQLIRSYGYTIHSRPDHGEPIWKRNGHLFTQSRVMERIGRKQAAGKKASSAQEE